MNVGNDINLAMGKQWSFDNDVPFHFDIHVQQSVPLYLEGHELVCFLSDFFIKDRSLCYEIGSSTGSLINKLYHRHRDKKEARFTGIEPVTGMIEEAVKRSAGSPVEYLYNTIENAQIEPCDFIVSYYCMQFIPSGVRGAVCKKIYEALNTGGAFLLFEKEIINNSKINEMIESCYLKFKLQSGFSVDEVLSKKFSLEGVMQPNTESENKRMLMAVGFGQIETIMKYGEFHGYLCIK